MPTVKGPLRIPLRRILCQGRSTLLHWAKCKEPTGTQSSANSAWAIVKKLSSDKEQSTLICKFGNPLRIPCLSCLRWLSGGLCHVRKCRFEDILWKKVCFPFAQRMFAWETSGKRNGERKPVLSLVPGSCEHLASTKKHDVCQKYGSAWMMYFLEAPKVWENETRNQISVQPRKAQRN